MQSLEPRIPCDCCRRHEAGTSDLPVRPDNNLGGFTVASENPV